MNNRLSNLRLAMAGAAFLSTILPSTAIGAPFTLSLTTSFDCASAAPPAGVGSLSCNPALPQHLEWVQGSNPVSSLDLSDILQTGINVGDAAVIIGTITHTNVVIPLAFNYSINLINSFAVTDEADLSVDNFPPQAIKITFTETLNAAPCPPPNPQASICDDFFTFDLARLAPAPFIDSEGKLKIVQFGLVAGPGAAIIGDKIFTAEASTSSISITAKIVEVDTPETLLLFGMGLVALGIGVQRRRRLH